MTVIDVIMHTSTEVLIYCTNVYKKGLVLNSILLNKQHTYIHTYLLPHVNLWENKKIRKYRNRKYRKINFLPFCRSRKQNLFVNVKQEKYDSSSKQVKIIGFSCFQHFVFPVKINLCCHVYECKCTLRRMSH
jgi:hypothetical protein